MTSSFAKLICRRSARAVIIFLAGLLLLTVTTFALRGVNADMLGKFGITEQSRVGKLIGKQSRAARVKGQRPERGG